jgi:hypothetical protein
MRTIIALAMILTASVANAPPAVLSCSGDWIPTFLDQSHENIFLITIDLERNEVKYKDRTMTIQTTRQTQDTELYATWFGKDNPRGENIMSSVSIDRVTGALKLNETVGMPAGYYTFTGHCHVVQKPF